MAASAPVLNPEGGAGHRRLPRRLGSALAALLFTAGWSGQNPSMALTHAPVGYLTYPIWSSYQYGPASVALSYDSAVLLLMLVLLLIILGRGVIALSRRHAE
jgi:phosphate transport system permease protein